MKMVILCSIADYWSWACSDRDVFQLLFLSSEITVMIHQDRAGHEVTTNHNMREFFSKMWVFFLSSSATDCSMDDHGRHTWWLFDWRINGFSVHSRQSQKILNDDGYFNRCRKQIIIIVDGQRTATVRFRFKKKKKQCLTGLRIPVQCQLHQDQPRHRFFFCREGERLW